VAMMAVAQSTLCFTVWGFGRLKREPSAKLERINGNSDCQATRTVC